MDPEAMECKCMNIWHPQCQKMHGNGSSYDRCIQCKICGQDNTQLPLCKPWKMAANCDGCTGLMQVNAENNMASNGADNSMDASLQGNCQ